jgi:hypothetical protein
MKGAGGMKALWRKYFYIPADEPISDRVFMAWLTLDVCLILLYLLCMAYAAYALFSSGAAAAI